MEEELSVEGVTWDDMETAEAVLYAAARRYCLVYEENGMPQNETAEMVPDAGYRVADAAHRWHEAFERWREIHHREHHPQDKGE
jgi:hypothetical protein